MPTVTFNKPARSPQGLDRVVTQGGIGGAIAQAGGQLQEFASEQADKLIEQRAKLERSQAERTFKTNFQRKTIEVLSEPGLVPEELATRLEEARLASAEEALAPIRTGRGKRGAAIDMESLAGGAERQAADLVFKRTGEITVADTDAQTELLREDMATANPAERARIRQQILDLNAGLEPWAGVDGVEKRRQALIRDTREIEGFAQTDAILDIANGKFEREQGLKFAEDVKYGLTMKDEEMTPDERVQLGNRLISYIGTLERDKEGRRSYLLSIVNRQKVEAKRGRVLTEYKNILPAISADPYFAPHIEEVDGNMSGGLMTRRPSGATEAGERLQELEAKGELTRRESFEREVIKSQIKAQQEARQTLTQSEAAELGYQPSAGVVVDWSKSGDELLSGLIGAGTSGDGMSKAVGQPVLALSDQSLAELSELLDEGNHGRNYEKLATMKAAFSAKQYSDVMDKLRPDQRVMAYAATLPPETGVSIMRGQELLSQRTEIPPRIDFDSGFEKVIGNAFERMGKTRGLVHDASLALTAYRAGKDAVVSDAQRATREVLNPIAERNGGKFFTPSEKMDEDSFDDIYDTMKPEQIRPELFGQPVDEKGRDLTFEQIRKHGRLISVGNGTYEVQVNGGNVLDGQRPGKLWRFQLGSIMEAAGVLP